jgi:hypothetical protein
VCQGAACIAMFSRGAWSGNGKELSRTQNCRGASITANHDFTIKNGLSVRLWPIAEAGAWASSHYALLVGG